MRKINLLNAVARDAVITNQTPDLMEVTFGASGGGVTLCDMKGIQERYVVGNVEILEDHSVAMELRCYLPGQDKERFYITFGQLPGLKAQVCFDMKWLDNGSIFTNTTPGTLKLVIKGQRTDPLEVERFELGIDETFHDVRVRLDNFYMTDEYPKEFPLPDKKLVDEFGQWKPKEWPGKVHSLEELKEVMKANEGPAKYPFPEWNKWGGDSTRKLKEGTGFFSTIKTPDGRWHLVDPDGCDYFSLGPCGIREGNFGRIDNYEKFCDWLPEDDPAFADCFQAGTGQRTAYMPKYTYKMVDFPRINMRRVYGDAWYEKWEEMTAKILMSNGINSQGNFPNLHVNDGKSIIPYVREIRGFPVTKTLIFRDFPDVLSPEYHENAEKYAATLEEWKDDPWLIGYFLRNEPEFNFVKDLLIADEVLHNPARTYCRVGLIQFLRGRYGTVEKLNEAWGTAFKAFEDLEQPIDFCSTVYPKSEPDIHEFSVYLMKEYIRVPAEACRKIDKNHLNLGLRWSEADNDVMMAGWEYFDVFSVNCYYFDPTPAIEFPIKHGVDLPIMIGEYHCGALDRGLTATGLKGVKNQYERGVMWRYFVEKVAAHPYGIGAHWFQYNDQFCLGRMDGENYQIGMVDVCMRPHKELLEAAYETNKVLYKVKNGEQAPYDRYPDTMPMIGY